MEKLRAKAKEAFGARDYLTAEQLYTDVLDLLSDEKGELVAKIYCNRALTKTKVSLSTLTLLIFYMCAHAVSCICFL